MIGRESPSSMRLASVHILNVTAWKMSHCWKFSWNIPPFLQNKQITEMRMDGQIEAWWKYSAKHHACCWGWNIIDFFLGFCTLYNTTNYLSVAMMICFLAFEIHNIMVLMSDLRIDLISSFNFIKLITLILQICTCTLLVHLKVYIYVLQCFVCTCCVSFEWRSSCIHY